MRASDDDRTGAGTCRDTILDLIFAGQIPNERNLEMLLDRLEREPERRPPTTERPR